MRTTASPRAGFPSEAARNCEGHKWKDNPAFVSIGARRGGCIDSPLKNHYTRFGVDSITAGRFPAIVQINFTFPARRRSAPDDSHAAEISWLGECAREPFYFLGYSNGVAVKRRGSFFLRSQFFSPLLGRCAPCPPSWLCPLSLRCPGCRAQAPDKVGKLYRFINLTGFS